MDHQDVLKYLRRSAALLPIAAASVLTPQAQAQNAWDNDADTTKYKVVINHEEQYSIWPVDREMPLGWSDTGKTCLKQECLDYIEQVWTDMRPLSLRKKMEEAAAQGQEKPNAARCKVVVNDDEEYAVLSADQELAEGWYDTGMVGTTAECEEYVKKVRDQE